VETCPKCNRPLECGEELCPACTAKKNRENKGIIEAVGVVVATAVGVFWALLKRK